MYSCCYASHETLVMGLETKTQALFASSASQRKRKQLFYIYLPLVLEKQQLFLLLLSYFSLKYSIFFNSNTLIPSICAVQPIIFFLDEARSVPVWRAHSHFSFLLYMLRFFVRGSSESWQTYNGTVYHFASMHTTARKDIILVLGPDYMKCD